MGCAAAHHLRRTARLSKSNTDRRGQATCRTCSACGVKEAVFKRGAGSGSTIAACYGHGARPLCLAEYRRITAQAGDARQPAAAGHPDHAKRGRRKQSKPRNLLLRLASRWPRPVLPPFSVRPSFRECAFTANNQAERDLRMMKVQQKISGTFRSEDGAVAFCQTRSYISTIRKNGGNVIEALTSVFAGNPIVPPCLTSAIPAE